MARLGAGRRTKEEKSVEREAAGATGFVFDDQNKDPERRYDWDVPPALAGVPVLMGMSFPLKEKAFRDGPPEGFDYDGRVYAREGD